MTGKFTHRIEHQCKIGNRFYTQETTHYESESTWENVHMATCADT